MVNNSACKHVIQCKFILKHSFFPSCVAYNRPYPHHLAEERGSIHTYYLVANIGVIIIIVVIGNIVIVVMRISFIPVIVM